jgi:hypothetical protein
MIYIVLRCLSSSKFFFSNTRQFDITASRKVAGCHTRSWWYQRPNGGPHFASNAICWNKFPFLCQRMILKVFSGINRNCLITGPLIVTRTMTVVFGTGWLGDSINSKNRPIDDTSVCRQNVWRLLDVMRLLIPCSNCANCVVSMHCVLDLGQKDFEDLLSHRPLACDFHRLLVTESQNMLKFVFIRIKWSSD